MSTEFDQDEKPWRKYEAAAREVLKVIGKDSGIAAVEGKQDLPGKSGTTWEVDAKAILGDGQKFVLIEVRRYTTKSLDQESVGAFIFRIDDVGASGGVIVSPLPLQSGAVVVAKSRGIEHLRLAPDSSAADYLAEYMGRRFLGVSMTSKAVAATLMDATVIPSRRS